MLFKLYDVFTVLRTFKCMFSYSREYFLIHIYLFACTCIILQRVF